MIERAKGQVLVWADLPAEQRARDGDADVLVPLSLALKERTIPPSAERCQAASQGNVNNGASHRLAKCGRFFRCVQRRKRHGQSFWRFCWRHQTIVERGAGAMR